MKKVLTIAGSDCSGGAGIQADLKTMCAHKVYGMSVITALTAQNTTGVEAIFEVTPEFVSQQLDCVFTDIIPDAVKIGMVSNAEVLEVIVQKLKQYNVKNIVVDPVMVATSGSKLLTDTAVNAVTTKLLPIATIITPNLFEAEVLTNLKISNANLMIEAAKRLSLSIDAAILIKGGHSVDNANDLLYINNEIIWMEGKRINNPNTHGTGCTLSSAIACNLALGMSIQESVKLAKNYISNAIGDQLNLGKGRGPLNHLWK